MTIKGADTLPPSLTLPHKGGGNEPAQAATVVDRSPAELNFIFH